jgi:aminoglycoside phosphotransferase (APT) family kinase protein
LEEALEFSRRWLDEDPLAFTHGDCHPGNVVPTDENRFVAIDWGNAGAGLPWCDLGRCLAITGLYFGDWQWIREGYEAARPISAETDRKVRTWMCLTFLEAGWGIMREPETPKGRLAWAEVRAVLQAKLCGGGGTDVVA